MTSSQRTAHREQVFHLEMPEQLLALQAFDELGKFVVIIYLYGYDVYI